MSSNENGNDLYNNSEESSKKSEVRLTSEEIEQLLSDLDSSEDLIAREKIHEILSNQESLINIEREDPASCKNGTRTFPMISKLNIPKKERPEAYNKMFPGIG